MYRTVEDLMMRRQVLATAMAVALVAGAVPAFAQGQQPAGFKNLQVFPKDAPRDVVLGAMKNIAGALGVRCPFCHAAQDPAAPEKLDYSLDTKPEKQIARAMMRMTAEINGHVTKAIPDAAANSYQVTCYTCHRGAEHPQHTAPPKPAAN